MEKSSSQEFTLKWALFISNVQLTFFSHGLSLLSSVGKFKEPPLSTPLCLPVLTKKAVEFLSLPFSIPQSSLGEGSSLICLTNLKKIYKHRS